MYDFAALAANKFADADLETLKAIAKDENIKLPGNCGAEYIRQRLNERMGDFNPTIEAAPQSPAPSNRTTVKPGNLTGYGRWEGRRHRVKMLRANQQDTAKGVPIGWEGAGSIYALYDAPYVDLPEPHFNNLNNSLQTHFTVSAYVERGKIIREDQNVTKVRDYPFEYRGVTPGTENLPGSLLEWYQWEAERKNYFERFTQTRLEEIFAELYGFDPQKDPKTGLDRTYRWDKAKIRKEVLRFLGVDYLAKGYVREEEEEEAA